MSFSTLQSPLDIRSAEHALAVATTNKARESSKSRPVKRRKLNESLSGRKSKATDADEAEEVYHFIGYVPAYGKVWELDGLKSGPLEVGELQPGEDWMNIVRPALRLKMQRYGGGMDDGGNIRFSLLALVDDHFLTINDELELLKRESVTLQRRLDEMFAQSWHQIVIMILMPFI